MRVASDRGVLGVFGSFWEFLGFWGPKCTKTMGKCTFSVPKRRENAHFRCPGPLGLFSGPLELWSGAKLAPKLLQDRQDSPMMLPRGPQDGPKRATMAPQKLEIVG